MSFQLNKYDNGLTLIILFLILFQLPFIIQGQGVWRVINPEPPLDEYRKIQFVDGQIGFSIGQYGRIIKTENGGINWFELTKLNTAYLHSLYFHDSLTGWVSGNRLYKTIDGGENWEQMTYHDSLGFNSLCFTDAMTGYGGKSGNIYLTQDGGISWTKVFDGYSWITKIQFVNSDTGYVLRRHSVMKTLNGGESWINHSFTSEAGDFQDMEFADEENGWIVSRENFIFRTTNGGDTWDTISSPETWDYFKAVYCFSELNARVFTDDRCFITIDGGLTWETEEGFFSGHLKDVDYINENQGCRVGDYDYGDYIQYTNNSGYNWESAEYGHFHDQAALCLLNDDEIFTGGEQGIVMYSSNNGLDWQEKEIPVNNYITGMELVDEDKIWLCTKGGYIFSTEDKGETWQQSTSNTITDLTAISFSNASRGICVGKAGTVLYTHDGGQSWNTAVVPVENDLTNVFFINDIIGWACGTAGTLLNTTDGGISWQENELEAENDLYSIFFISESRGWIGTHRKIYSTFNGGENWDLEMDSDLGHRIYSIHFIDAMNGYAAGFNGHMFHTTNGGVNWVYHRKVIEEHIHAISYRNPDEVFAVGEFGNVLYTSQGTYLAPSILKIPGDTLVCEDEEAVLECLAIGDSIQYQWYYSNLPIPDETSPQHVTDSLKLDDGGFFKCRVYSGAGSTTSPNFILSVIPKARITGHPIDQTVYVNDTVVFSQASTGGLPLNYQWQKDGVDIEGAIFNVHPIYGVKQSDSGKYRCIVFNDCAVDTTHPANLTVFPESAIIETQNEQIYLVPNPATDKVKLLIPRGIDSGKVIIYSIRGVAELETTFSSTRELDLDIGMLEKGLYFIQMESAQKSVSIKLIKN